MGGRKAPRVGRIGLQRPESPSESVIRRTGIEVEAALQQEQIKQPVEMPRLRTDLPEGRSVLPFEIKPRASG